MWYNLKFLELSVFMCFRRVFSPKDVLAGFLFDIFSIEDYKYRLLFTATIYYQNFKLNSIGYYLPYRKFQASRLNIENCKLTNIEYNISNTNLRKIIELPRIKDVGFVIVELKLAR